MPSVTMFSQSKFIADASDGRRTAIERKGLGVKKAGRMVGIQSRIEVFPERADSKKPARRSKYESPTKESQPRFCAHRSNTSDVAEIDAYGFLTLPYDASFAWPRNDWLISKHAKVTTE